MFVSDGAELIEGPNAGTGNGINDNTGLDVGPGVGTGDGSGSDKGPAGCVELHGAARQAKGHHVCVGRCRAEQGDGSRDW